uniref:F-box domain-containing protein n=1 Tax=Emiliania huxleyi TaxID=2903 RepID=A0A7S3SBD5_EMIHU|mmetsp:Transcript_29136/g.87104  ORF Transcript_29136/g.87104 Transcript_29136/m.87104 type:complete len:274 (-) Transcript_29136:137-958(-)
MPRTRSKKRAPASSSSGGASGSLCERSPAALRLISECLDSDDLLLHVLGLLPLAGLGRAACVSSRWARLAASNSLWASLAERVWEGRHVSEACRAQRRQHGRSALRRSLAESEARHIDPSLLCELTWHFRFKRAAGEHWTGSDPYWQGARARTLRFEPDGAVRWEEEAWDGLMRWRLEGGSLLRVSHAQLGAFPAERLVRHPPSWGYLFTSPWAVYASFPLSRAVDDASLTDRALGRSVEPWQWAEAARYNEAAAGESSSDDEDAPPPFPAGV